MKDSIGGVVNIMFIGVFLLVVSGYLAFSVSYNKAFRTKNKIIKILEQTENYDEAVPKINDALKEIGYNSNDQLNIGSFEVDGKTCTPNCSQPGYCITWIDTSSDQLKSGYFKVTTSSVMNIPILNKIAGVDILKVSGDTITLYPDVILDSNCK